MIPQLVQTTPNWFWPVLTGSGPIFGDFEVPKTSPVLGSSPEGHRTKTGPDLKALSESDDDSETFPLLVIP